MWYRMVGWHASTEMGTTWKETAVAYFKAIFIVRILLHIIYSIVIQRLYDNIILFEGTFPVLAWINNSFRNSDLLVDTSIRDLRSKERNLQSLKYARSDF
jgi:hypothetical protein